MDVSGLSEVVRTKITYIVNPMSWNDTLMRIVSTRRYATRKMLQRDRLPSFRGTSCPKTGGMNELHKSMR